jgi:hypothetical protein
MNKVTWWYEVDHIICDMVGACVASTLEEMEWIAQGKGIIYRAFHFTGHRWTYFQEGQTRLHIDHLVPLEWSNFASLVGSSGMVNWVTNPLKNVCENANTLAHDGVHLVVLAHLQMRRSWRSFGETWVEKEKWWFLDWNSVSIHCALDQICMWDV